MNEGEPPCATMIFVAATTSTTGATTMAAGLAAVAAVFRHPDGRRGGLGIGTILVLGLIGWAVGIDPRILIGGAEILGGGGGAPSVQMDRPSPASPKREAPKDQMGAFISASLGSMEDRWNEIFKERDGRFTPPRIVLFSNATNGGRCGRAQSAMGPFYCPPDQLIYLDTGFFREVETRFRGCTGSACKFTAAYIIAHEFGHHVQNQLGILDRVRRRNNRRVAAPKPTASGQGRAAGGLPVRTVGEQAEEEGRFPRGRRHRRGPADCNRDWRRHVAAPGTGPVVPDSFTHGSAEQRKRWFMTGYQQGTIEACNTFAPSVRL